MLTRLKIQNFKGIQTCDVKDLRRVNLLVGKNDSGKSTILEAAYHMFQELHSPPILNRIMSRRTNVFTGGNELWFRYEMNTPIIISAWFDSPPRPLRFEWKVSWDESTAQIISHFICDISHPKKPVKGIHLGRTQYVGTDFSHGISMSGNSIDALPLSQSIKKKVLQYALNMSLIDCSLKSDTNEIERALGWLKIKGKDVEFGKILNDIYGKGKEWEFMPHPDNPDEKRLAIREAGGLTYFSDFGDGLRYCVGILGTAVNRENTALFIEEIESHQHSGSLRKLIKHLVEIVRKNNLQVLLSTHSNDVWNSLVRGVYLDDAETEKKEFRCFLVERDEETGKTTAESTDDVQKITAALGKS